MLIPHKMVGSRLKFFKTWIIHRPLSVITSISGIVLIIVPLSLWRPGNPYLAALDYVDLTTLILVGLILLAGVWVLRFDADLQAVSMGLLGAVSFLYSYEAIFKLSFYTFPWRMPSAELREFTLQIAVALCGLVGFAFGRFRLTRWSWLWLLIFAIGMSIWYAIGFPQLVNNQRVFTPLIEVSLDWKWLYWLNRSTKIALAFFYLSLFYKPEAAQLCLN
jgi:hypothetical protein